jgi:hypothetical protein
MFNSVYLFVQFLDVIRCKVTGLGGWLWSRGCVTSLRAIVSPMCSSEMWEPALNLSGNEIEMVYVCEHGCMDVWVVLFPPLMLSPLLTRSNTLHHFIPSYSLSGISLSLPLSSIIPFTVSLFCSPPIVEGVKMSPLPHRYTPSSHWLWSISLSLSLWYSPAPPGHNGPVDLYSVYWIAAAT